MKMKKIGVLLMMLISISAFSQRDMTQRGSQKADMSSEKIAAMQTEKLNKKLNLTAAQQVEIRELFKQQAEERQAMRSSQREMRKQREAKRANRYAMKSQSVEKRAAMEAKMQQILTDEQFAIWKEDRATMKKDSYKKKGSGNKNKPVNKL